MSKLCLKDLDVKNKKVLLRVDFNVPFNTDGTISDDTRIQETLPSIRYILENGGSVILMSHLGRPDGQKNLKYSLLPCAKRLSELLEQEVFFSKDCIGEVAKDSASSLKPKQLLLLENLRFYSAEEKPSLDPTFAQNLAALGDCYVDDAFGASHRSHSSITEVPKYFPKASAAGFLMEKELKYLSLLIQSPSQPFYALIGGSKISSKIAVLESLLEKVAALFIGGGMSYTFLKANGMAIGDSICEDSHVETAKRILEKCKQRNIPLYLPLDVVAADRFANEAKTQVFQVSEGIPKRWQGMDIGPKTCTLWESVLSDGKTIFWNGPFGVFEFPNFSKGTEHIARFLANLKATTVVGGGDSVAAIQSYRLKDKFTHLSTGGGASLEFIEKKQLPGINALTNN